MVIMAQAKGMTTTKKLNQFLRNYTETKLKPQGMDSKLFWELYEVLVQTGRQTNGTN